MQSSESAFAPEAPQFPREQTPIAFDFKNPDYLPVWRARYERLQRLRRDPKLLAALKVYYRDHPADFVNDWGVTVDPRVIGQVSPNGQPRSAIMPFVLFPKQREWIDKAFAQWKLQKDLLSEKSRDCGLSWLAAGLSTSLCLFYRDVSIGFGSAKEDKVDRSGDPDCLFYKIRMFVNYLPREFRGDWSLRKNSAHMRVEFPATGGTITGEAGDNIGRGGRKSIYFVDEAAHVERPKLIDSSLSFNTNCRMDISSVNGTANSFSERRHSGTIEVFTFHWRDDPRKDQAWYDDFCARHDPIVVAQEADINYHASVGNVVIPQAWVQAAVDAHIKLNIHVSGLKYGSLDVADQGKDKNAYVSAHGVLVKYVESWSGAGKIDGREWEIGDTVNKAFWLADENEDDGYLYDADGLGANVRGDARKINDDRATSGRRVLRVVAFRGSGAVLDPERKAPGTERKNIDYFENYKAQSWWALRQRFLTTYRAVTQGLPFEASDIISIDSRIKERARLLMELSQPVFTQSKAGKMMIDKTPDDVASPNDADAVMMRFAYRREAIRINPALLEDVEA